MVRKELAPAPHSPYGWDAGTYHRIWSRQAAYALQMHAKTLRQIEVPVPGHVNRFENPPLVVIEGWAGGHDSKDPSLHGEDTAQALKGEGRTVSCNKIVARNDGGERPIPLINNPETQKI